MGRVSETGGQGGSEICTNKLRKANMPAVYELGEKFLKIGTSAHNSQTGLRTCPLQLGLSLWRGLPYPDIALTFPSTRAGGAGWDMQLAPPFGGGEK